MSGRAVLLFGNLEPARGVDSCLENVWTVAVALSHLVIWKSLWQEGCAVALTLGIDVAVRAAHQATLARDGKTVWRGRKFLTRPDELERVWADVGAEDPGELTVVLEPTRNAWIVVAEWFRRRGAKVVMVPTTQSADLRKYYSKHAKNDRIDSEPLARLALLRPEGLRPYTGQGPADPLRRLTKQRSTMVKRRTPRSMPASTPSSSCWDRPGMRCSGRTTATPRCSFWRTTPIPTQ
ncbi:transposase [Mycobacterium sp. SM1]|uniref:IS110 family transposase n=1 Tax=Mycobacterium sp. SM1 TaxID=2816243 RepID=UPI0027DC34BA|nr:transposase [Mycobacterium sp. SM1]